MVGVINNEGMWEGAENAQSRKDGQIKRLSFSKIKETNLLSVGSIANHSRTTQVGIYGDQIQITGKNNKIIGMTAESSSIQTRNMNLSLGFLEGIFAGFFCLDLLYLVRAWVVFNSVLENGTSSTLFFFCPASSLLPTKKYSNKSLMLSSFNQEQRYRHRWDSQELNRQTTNSCRL